MSTKAERFERWAIVLEGCSDKELQWLKQELDRELRERGKKVQQNSCAISAQ